jgi:hypothetical protein
VNSWRFWDSKDVNSWRFWDSKDASDLGLQKEESVEGWFVCDVDGLID